MEEELESTKKELELKKEALKEKRRVQKEERDKKDSVERALIDEGVEAPSWVKSFVKSIKSEENELREQKKPRKEVEEEAKEIATNVWVVDNVD